MRYKILITGASGFIGTNLLQFYLEKGFEVLNIDFNPPLNKDHNKFWRNVNILNYDLLSKEIIKFGPDFVVHLAAKTDLDGKDLSGYSSNIEGVQNIVDVLKKCKNLKRVIFASSQLVCKGKTPKDDDDYFTDTFYGESKKLGEQIIKYDENIHYEWFIIRLTSIWGPWFREPYRNFFNLLLSGKYFHISTRSCIKTFGYVENIIYQINELVFISKENINNQIIYLGDKEPYNIEEWANEIAKEAGIRIRRLPFFIVKILAITGDLLKLIGINFPMNSYRLSNMTTNNIIDVEYIYTIAPYPPSSRVDGIRKTLYWLSKFKDRN